MAMSWPVDCGFFERMTTGPADAVVVDFTKLSPLAATSISTTCPPAALETADVAEDAADDNADEMPPAEGTLGEEVPPSDDPQPAPLTSTIAAAAATIRLHIVARSGIPDRIPRRLLSVHLVHGFTDGGGGPNHPARGPVTPLSAPF
jgi:hypothetical protein